MAPKKKRGQKADTEESGPAQESNKKQRKAGGKKTKVKKPEDLENEYSKFVGEEKGRVMKEFEEQKETITEDTEDYEQMIREVMWVRFVYAALHPSPFKLNCNYASQFDVVLMFPSLPLHDCFFYSYYPISLFTKG